MRDMPKNNKRWVLLAKRVWDGEELHSPNYSTRFDSPHVGYVEILRVAPYQMGFTHQGVQDTIREWVAGSTTDGPREIKLYEFCITTGIIKDYDDQEILILMDDKKWKPLRCSTMYV